MEPFLEFTASWSNLDPNEYIDAIMNIWGALSDVAHDLKERSALDPTNKKLEKSATSAAKNLLAFGDMMKAANVLTKKRIEDMRDTALEDTSLERNKRIIELADSLIDLYSQKKEKTNKPN